MEKKCEYCSTSFTCQRTSRKYCSDNCKQMAYYKRNGFVLSGNSAFVSSLPSLVSVKYGNTLRKQDKQPAKKSAKLMTSIPFHDESTVLPEENQAEELKRILQDFTVNDIDHNNIIQNEDSAIASEINERTNHADNDNLQNHSAPSTINSGTIKYKWVDSTFLEYVERYLNDDSIDIGKYQYNAEYIKVLECFKCLTGVLIQLSNRPKVDPDFFIKIAIAFSSLVQSKTFNAIPAHFPFLSVIHELNNKLSIATQNGEISKVYLSPKRKALLVSIRFKMGKDIKDLKLSEVIR